MNALVIGASGMVGKQLFLELKSRGYEVYGTHYIRPVYDTLYMDVRSPRGINNVFGVSKPNVVFVPAYNTAVDWCERNELKSRKVNVDGMVNVLKACNAFDAFPVFFSSGYVFDGELSLGSTYVESDTVNPLCVYGKQKLDVEKVIGKGLVIRTIGVFDKDGINYVNQVIRSALNASPIYTPVDQYMNPISAKSLAQRAINLYEDGMDGIIHVAGRTCLSKFEWAVEIAKAFELPAKYIVPCPTEDLNQPAKRPVNACLGSEYFENENILTLEEELRNMRGD